MLSSSLTFASPVWLMIAVGAMVIVMSITLLRRADLPRGAAIWMAAGLLALALAAGEPHWRFAVPGEVVVMIDRSASTRGAQYRDENNLKRRLDELLGSTRHRIVDFAEQDGRTVFTPPAADVVLLFSDAQFELPSIDAPVYVVVDSALENLNDARVMRLEQRDSRLLLAVENHGPPRELSVQGLGEPKQFSIPTRAKLITEPLESAAGSVTAILTAGDAWPENDALSLIVAPAASSQRWWVGNNPPDQWTALSPAELPSDAVDYLAASVIVLNNIAAEDLTRTQQDRLQQYVRDLGGAIVIVGGEHAFAAGGYAGTALEAISPLASHPPQPSRHWVLLIDHSGSMAREIQGRPAIQYATDAAIKTIAQIPPHDLISVGGFARDLRWWVTRQPAESVRSVEPPAPPHGPTNLDAALRAAAEQTQDDSLNELLLMTDGQAQIESPDELVQLLKQKRIRLHVLALGQGAAIGQLEQIARDTDGTFATELEATKWAESATRLIQGALPDHWMKTPITIQYDQPIEDVSSRRLREWNRTWLKSGAALLAYGEHENQRMPLIARQQLGVGKTIAAAFAATSGEASALAEQITAAPRDPRLSVTWETGQNLRVRVDAKDGQEHLNRLRLMLELRPQTPGASPTLHPVPQVAPGVYELTLPAPRQTMIATLRHHQRTVDRIAVAGRYPPEFEALGNNRRNMEALASRTGGKIIKPDDHNRIDFNWPKRAAPLTSYVIAGGALLLSLGLIRWRIH